MSNYSVNFGTSRSMDDEDPSDVAHLDVLKEKIAAGKGTELGMEIANMQVDRLRRLDFLLNTEGRTVLDFNWVEEPDMDQVRTLTDELLRAKEGSEQERKLRAELGKLLA